MCGDIRAWCADSSFPFSEKETWQKEMHQLVEAKNKLEEQKEIDGVKIKEFSVSKSSMAVTWGCSVIMVQALYRTSIVLKADCVPPSTG